MAIDWRAVIFHMLTIKGIYGREMYETWYKMTVMLQSGLDISPVITHRYPLHRVPQGLRSHGLGQLRQSGSELGRDFYFLNPRRKSQKISQI
jgi:threonine 3-dehydrogenase